MESTSEKVNWAAAVQMEQCRATKIHGLMQAIAAVPMFEGNPEELDYFIRRMDLIAQQLMLNPLDDQSTKHVLGYLYGRISWEVFAETGLSCDTAWEVVREALQEKFKGATKSMPKMVLREVLVSRQGGENSLKYARNILKGFWKVRDRMKTVYTDAEECRIRTQMLAELAEEVILTNMPRRIRQWVRISKPTSIEQLVKVIEEEEEEEREERWEKPRIKPREEERRYAWTTVDRRPGPRRVERRTIRKEPIKRTPTYQTRRGPERKTDQRSRVGCWECGESGHFARECPYIFRRQEFRPLRRETGWRPEPMEINHISTRRHRKRDTIETTSDSEAEQSSAGSEEHPEGERACESRRKSRRLTPYNEVVKRNMGKQE